MKSSGPRISFCRSREGYMTREAQTMIRRAEKIGTNLIKVAAVYLLVGLTLGIGMGVSHDFRLSSVHAHILLIGWATMVISGVVYVILPNCGNGKSGVRDDK